MSNPVVSVVMPVYNGERFVAEAIESVLRQKFRDFEFILVDDGSSDGTAARLRFYGDSRIVILSNPSNQGLVASLNRAIAAARGRYIARADADDTCHEDRFAKQVAFLEENQSVGVLGSCMDQVDESGRPAPFFWVPSRHNEIAWTMMFETSMAHPTVMIRRQVLVDAGGYDPDYRHIEDIELWTRLLSVTRFANLGEALYTRRCHSESVCAKNSALQAVLGRQLRHRMWERVLGRSVDMALLEWLSEETHPVLARTRMMQVMEIMLELMERFTAVNGVSGTNLDHVHKDVVYRMLSVAQRNGYVHPSALKHPWKQMVPAPLKHMLKHVVGWGVRDRISPGS